MSKNIQWNQRNTKNDIIYTPKEVALLAISMCDIDNNDILLDPCYGGGVFYNNFPPTRKKLFCEIAKGEDFFLFKEQVDWVIGNPPFSIWNKWLEHTVKITDKFCYIIGIMNMIPTRLDKIHKAGFGITKLHLCKVYWWFSPVLIMIAERGKPSIISCSPTPFLCDKCNSRCKRGRGGIGMNVCSKENLN